MPAEPAPTSATGRLTFNCTVAHGCTAELRASFRRTSAPVRCLSPVSRRISRNQGEVPIAVLRHPTSHIHSVRLVESVRAEAQVIDPSWQGWIDLVTLGVAESERPVWTDSPRIHASREVDAPLLHLATLRVEPTQASNLVMRLAGQLGMLGVDRVDPLALILAGIERDDATLDALAGRLGVPADTVAVLAQVSALPILLNAARQLDPETSRSWQRGYCPVCGAWPALVEMRGIQRERRLRCGCCSSDWMLPVLRCAFCNEMDHNRLGFLLTEEGDQQVRVETCSTCRGYLKTLSTLSPLPFAALVTRDLATVAFDLAARGRGYARPSRPGWQIRVEIVQ